ncbi:undecaprenyl-diphosphate phosphatase [Actinobacteria bacterium YIM 96077]|uniref:Undecaprenyl-diphosphatase n=1 Tax=Phytoactinopolyspora halophila TaxID=1981511 RepID=A0A329R5Z0_9ACTN|nr:undecaprenyl-diphosphate phosphatase [Phytoactinopolyspora halophila]AYY11914.1 undecaprenyl-diphosphate phosphatase [Actinobacteria bacterium YIM 96077]RAW18852.1 undecaprenyl-diphosphate phosphatase [Phytoactinopolyspora halophila]
MTLLEAGLLGIVQGLFMFIPVSSTSHLALTQHWLLDRGSGMPEPDSPEMILFDIVVHVGTLVSIILVMRGSLGRLIAGILGDVRYALARPPRGAHRRGVQHDDGRRRKLGELHYLRMAWLGVVTVAVTGVLGLIVRAVGTEQFANPAAIAGALFITGAILWWTDTTGPQWRDARHLTVWVAVGIGVAQAAALLPGLSRSGLTIAMALLLGLHRKLAAEYSFFIAIPTILSAVAVQALDVLGEPDVTLAIGFSAYAVGFVVAAIVGAGALLAVLKLLYQARFRFFSVYVVALAIAILVVQPVHL